MRTVRLFHWRAGEAQALIDALRDAGYRVLHNPETQSPSVREIQEAATFAIVIDLSRLPSHGRYVGAWVRGSKGTRHIPLIFAGGEAEKVAAIKKEIPDAIYTSHARLPAVLKRVKPVEDPVVPRQMMQTDPQRTTAQKLGIREGMKIGLIDPPGDYTRVIGEIPEGVVLEENAVQDEPRDFLPMTLWFVHDPGEFEAALSARRSLASKGRLWIVWRKGRRDGLNGNFVRKPHSGWVWWITKFVRSTTRGAECCLR
ncbi:MAG TPA: hypothetical protein VGR73_22460 [Bryobacteraceae bacterium]|nr:hypothetical protein [Bryobacteraceae bacterium]